VLRLVGSLPYLILRCTVTWTSNCWSTFLWRPKMFISLPYFQAPVIKHFNKFCYFDDSKKNWAYDFYVIVRGIHKDNHNDQTSVEYKYNRMKTLSWVSHRTSGENCKSIYYFFNVFTTFEIRPRSLALLMVPLTYLLIYLLNYLLTYLLHGAESFLRRWLVCS
jgi:hypothetical protein